MESTPFSRFMRCFARHALVFRRKVCQVPFSAIRFVSVTRMLKAEDAASLPEPLSARHKDSYAYSTMKERQPRNLTKVIDYLHRERNTIAKKYGEDVLEDLKSINELLSGLRYEMMTDKPLRPIEDPEAPDCELWNKSIEESKWLHSSKHEDSSWFTAPWLLVECYLFRRMKEAFLKGSETGKLVDFDYFANQKEDALKSSWEPVQILGKFFLDKLSELKPENLESSKKLYLHLMELALWGNKNDLCNKGGQEDAVSKDPLEDLDRFRSNLLSDHLDDVWSFLVSSAHLGPCEIGIVTDNAAFELYSDLALGDYLVTSGIASRVVFHIKSMPWFVSDVLATDIEHLLASVAADEKISPLAARWRAHLSAKRWVVETDVYWTLAEPYHKMKTVRPSLYDRLAMSRLLIFKGDLNYRKLLGDLNWEHHTSFDLALQGFHPAALVALRTLKADLVAGLRPGVGKNAHLIDPEWMTAGRFGVVQFCGRKDTAGS